ncbi:MAG: FAD-dependent monooxygenase [Pseudomonadota bacterium]
MNHDYDVVVAGGGLNGLTLARALTLGGLRVCLADPRTDTSVAPEGFSGRSYALARASERVLTALGIWAELANVSQPILDIRVSDGPLGGRPSPFVLDLSHTQIDEGPMGFMIEDRHLRPALARALDNSITKQAGVRREVPGSNGTRVEFSDGSVSTTRLLVAADGRNSALATNAGIGRWGRDYNQTALVCAVEHDRPHGGTAYQHFLPSGPLAILPLTGNRSSIVWTERTRQATWISGLDSEAYLDELRRRFGNHLGEIHLAGERTTFPLLLSVARAFTARRLALIGDAAHAVHPIAGQGLNAGLRDVAALAEVVVEAARRGEDIGHANVLDRYQRWRRFDATALAFATDGFNSLFSNNNPVLRAGRTIGFEVVNRLPSLGRAIIREAAGLNGDLPRLARGQAL